MTDSTTTCEVCQQENPRCAFGHPKGPCTCWRGVACAPLPCHRLHGTCNSWMTAAGEPMRLGSMVVVYTRRRNGVRHRAVLMAQASKRATCGWCGGPEVVWVADDGTRLEGGKALRLWVPTVSARPDAPCGRCGGSGCSPAGDDMDDTCPACGGTGYAAHYA